MKTDIVLDHHLHQRRIVVETKFTDSLVDRDGKTTVETSHLYQLYAYLASQSGRRNALYDTAEGVLLFVKVDHRDPFDGEFTVQGHRIRFLSVDLSAEPADIRKRWMQCIDTAA
jgi:5-methylcytosine-specific restriction enzyme subunit McrC